ncbi:glycosyltransferase family 4 protein [Natronogracilivirga saccharolytica]|uniref:Glycosyltransferase family 4 protein n=1 Tax=Natronogracilivirga saccharolytica TaxID=2812953 RepID=A0A8J7RQ11_9BACT|nr:glycosyltransferase family 4 protein [Natronogracilivirga saccharolytica]MBP3193819.1 glycosyltransferase family 4 protein [Natronogracilivirga saccharolytica]
MNILFITDNFPPEVNAPATRTYEHCKEWVRQGARVTVITGAPNFPQGKVFDGYKNKLYQKEVVDGIQVVRVWTYITRNQGFMRRTLDYLSFAFTSFLAGLFQKADVIVATSPQFFTTWAGWALSKLKRKPWVFELRDLWPESIKSVGALNDGKLYQFLEKIELGLYDSADHIIPNTDAFRKNLIERGVDKNGISVITNGSNLDLFTPPPNGQTDALKAKLGISDKFTVGYIGTHGMAHALDFIVDSVYEMQDANIHFLFIGDGAEKENIRQKVEKYKLTNVTMLDPVPKNDMPLYLSIIDVSLVPLKKSDTFKTVIPSKIFEAAAMDKPVLLGVDGQARKIIEKYESGLYFNPENKADFIEKTRLIADNKELYKSLARNCRRLATDFDRKKLANEMLEVLSRV